MTTAEQRHQAQQQLNDLLKKSDYLNSILDSQRIAIADSFAILVSTLVHHDPGLAIPVREALNKIEFGGFISPSVDGDRSLLVRAVRAQLQR
ncbi:hypothetical protein [Undibacterium curvum]|uniref:hypothetical protein n=1 Tax=Undibacterium curvum TaxID=2762294 RepID=UPI003D14F3A1